MKKILFYGETSRYACHGISMSNDLFLKDLKKEFIIEVYEEVNDLSKYGKAGFSKILCFFNVLISIFKGIRISKPDFFYSVLNLSAFGSIKLLLLCLVVTFFSRHTKIIIHIHRGDYLVKVRSNWLIYFLNFIIFYLADKIALISEAQVKEFNNKKIMWVSKYSYICNSVDLMRYKVEKCKTNYYLYLSNYIKEKGIYDLLDAWACVKLKLLCFGGETPGISIMQLKEKYVDENITINGSIDGDKKKSIIACCHALILPSWNEGAPLVILEAMSLGVPIIASKVGFISEMVGEEYPFLFEPKNKKELITRILEFESLDQPARKKISNELLDRFESKYSRSNRIKCYKNIFN
ncbi:glycosyltransferase family 4 protein [Marinicellulosiphila megalodicopiae]|uniref:glycosyltransferase family 4 protein n=1 Tax=Marinicellulosiphila megalodicopiae TaxID=2724896 RepID=UPI003BAFF35C